MKVLPFKIPKPELANLVYQVDLEPYFYDKLHQHEDIQLSLIIQGEGTLIAGDAINHYKSGDIIILGSQQPHVFQSDRELADQSHMQSLFFTEDSFGTEFFRLEELTEIQVFFKRALHGFKATSHQEDIRMLFAKIENASKLERLIILLELLKLLSICEYKSLSSFIYEKNFSVTEGERMRDVFDYTMTHFDKDITLESVASVANMTKNAFCKYFKKYTNKTYVVFLNELRIEHACKHLLTSQDITISDVAYKVGFNNISNFNRQFKKVKHKTPLIYKQENSK
ncbi:AraC family transcriptional regulator [Xanthomarina sp. F2636L]|uniref:AraC family transcriptional regulator n=1 Tax=Xanthomarina sp. F2636L TaxID=2996018 RepID=UPI00225E6CAC|nr:AraC family transcriptional regulator [Xanthomarina sp. F2636L]MCX7551930.1 AraC family transcriptional regulator [Xanthomarina sp. F2636L]